MNEDDRRTLVRLWAVAVGLGLGIAIGLAASGIHPLACGVWGSIALPLAPVLVRAYWRRRRYGGSTEILQGLHDVSFYYSLTAILAAGVWLGVAAGNIYLLLRYHSSTQRGYWLVMAVSIVTVGAQGLGALKRLRLGDHVDTNRMTAWGLIGLAVLMALLTGVALVATGVIRS